MTIKEVLQNYHISDVLDIEKIQLGYANTNYKLITSDERYLYRIYKHHTKAQVAYEMEVLKVLKEMDFPAAYPIMRKDGEFFTSTKEGVVVIYEFIQGPATEVNEQVVREIASTLGRLHKIPYKEKGLTQRSNSISLERCQRLIQRFDSAPCQYPDIFEYFTDQTYYLRMPLQISIPRGLIHGDLFPDNTIFHAGELKAILDFEEVCVDNFLFDLGITINGFCFEGNQLNEQLTAIFLEEYFKKRQISPQEIKLLPTYISWAAHGMMAWHLENDLLNTENPKQLRRVHELMDRVKLLKNTQLVIARL